MPQFWPKALTGPWKRGVPFVKTKRPSPPTSNRERPSCTKCKQYDCPSLVGCGVPRVYEDGTIEGA